MMIVMTSSDDDSAFPVEELRAAAANGHLPALVERLARLRDFVRMLSMFERAHEVPIPLLVLTETVQRAAEALRRPGPGRREPRQEEEDKRAIRITAGEALLARAVRPPLTQADRAALSTAAAILADAGDFHRAATTFELADNLAGAAEVWGRLGDLEAMESSLARDEERHRRERASIGALRDAQVLLAAGERAAALEVARRIPEGSGESREARQIVLQLEGRLVRGRSVTLRLGGLSVRVAAAPAVLGRDLSAELPLRDPGVSRRHATLGLGASGSYTLTDSGSRLGTFLAGARLAGRCELAGDTDVWLGPSCRLTLQPAAPDGILLKGTAGLDAGLLALVGGGRVPLERVLPAAAGAWLELDGGTVALVHPPELTVRIAGHLAATRIELLHGDRLELGSAGAPVTVEVP
jgi:hypothetical protein